jgi:dephospho-CoA kinase
MKKQSSLYWICQIAGWFSYGLTILFFASILDKELNESKHGVSDYEKMKKDKESIVDFYMRHVREYREKYGERTIVLVESGHWRPRLHQVLVIDCTESRQISRVMQRNAWTREAVQKVMAGQADRAQRLAAADLCIYNETVSLVELAALVRSVAQRFGL